MPDVHARGRQRLPHSPRAPPTALRRGTRAKLFYDFLEKHRKAEAQASAAHYRELLKTQI